MNATVPMVARPAAAVGAMAVTLGVFVARPFLPGTWPLMALFTVLLAVGVAWPLASGGDHAGGKGAGEAGPAGGKVAGEAGPAGGKGAGEAGPRASGAGRGPVADVADRESEARGAGPEPGAEGVDREGVAVSARRVRATAGPTRAAVVLALVVGIGAFGLGRLLGGDHPPAPFRPGYVAGVTLAAVAEEAFFRRFVYSVLRPGGVTLAVAGSAVLFAVAHVTVYGWWVLPLDLAAGLVLSWQRWAAGTWTVPAVTHVVANLMVAL